MGPAAARIFASTQQTPRSALGSLGAAWLVPTSKVARQCLTAGYPAGDDAAVNRFGGEKMNGKAVAALGSLCVALAWLGVGSADDAAPQRTTKQPAPALSARQTCINQCELANGTCNSEVRQARQECSRKAANSGRDPMTMRNDYTYFCSYFRNPGRSGPGNFSARFTQHYNVCIDVMQQNIASMRYDCYRNERDAQNICRTELRECQAACQ